MPTDRVRAVALLLALVFVADASAQPPRDTVHGELIQLNPNGAWSWFQDERAIVDTQRNELIVGSIANQGGVGGHAVDGEVQVTHYNLETGERRIVTLGVVKSYGAGDDHNVPALLKKQDGDVLAFFAGHNKIDGKQDDRSFYRTMDAATGKWGPVSEFHWWPAMPDNTPGRRSGTTYSNLFQLADEDPDGDGHGRLYNIARTRQSPHLMISDDNGETWRYTGQLTKQASTKPAGANYVNGYYKYWSNGRDRIDLVATEYHPRNFNNSLYHAYIQGGKLHDSRGNVIDEDLFDAVESFDPAKVASTDDFTPVFKAGADENSRAWNTDIHRYTDGSISVLFKARDGGYADHAVGADDHNVWLARFDPATKAWASHEIARAGGQLFPGNETDYTGLGALDPDDPSTLFISTEINPTTGEPTEHHEIYKGVTPDNGKTWKWSAITERSTVDNLRPIVPKWDEQHTALVWWRGTMRRSQDYNAQVVGVILDEAGPADQ